MNPEEKVRYIIANDSYFDMLFLCDITRRLRPDWLLAGTADETPQVIDMLGRSAIDLLVIKDRLSDGDIMESFSRHGVTTPVILISDKDRRDLATASLNLIDCILEPVAPSDLEAAFSNFYQTKTNHH